MERWSTKRVLITVRTYPVPARKGIEVSCTGGITADGNGYGCSPCHIVFWMTTSDLQNTSGLS